MGLENLLRLEEIGHFWIQGKQLAIEEMVCRLRPKNLLDIGCGTGSVLKQLSSEGIGITGIDILPQSVELCKKRLPKATVDF